MSEYNWKNDTILLWLDVFTKPQSSFREVETAEDANVWEPQGDEEKEAFAKLVANENRELLKAWYARHDYLNPAADLFHQVLERAIGERLPCKDAS